MRRILIVGSGRSGTGWASEVLRQLGVACGHESIFDNETADPAVPYNWPKTLDAEASWLAIPRLPLVGIGVVQIVRDPLAVVKSHLDLGFFQNDHVYTRAALAITPAIANEHTEADMSLLHWLRLNELAAPYADLTFQLEQIDETAVEHILALGGHSRSADEIRGAIKLEPVNRKDESKLEDHHVSWDSFRPQLAEAARAAAGRWGY